MKLNEIPFFHILEAMTKEEKQVYLPGLSMAAIMDYTIAVNETPNDEDRQEYGEMIDDLYTYAHRHGVDTPELQQMINEYSPIAIEGVKALNQ